MSKRANSQPADFMMWPIPGVANSTMKCPSFKLRERVISFRPVCIMFYLPSLNGCRRQVSGTLAHEIADRHLLLRHMFRTSPVEQIIVRRFQMILERRTIVIDLIEQNAVGFARRFEHVETLAPWLGAAGIAGIGVDEPSEFMLGAGLQTKIDKNHIGPHVPPVFACM